MGFLFLLLKVAAGISVFVTDTNGIKSPLDYYDGGRNNDHLQTFISSFTPQRDARVASSGVMPPLSPIVSPAIYQGLDLRGRVAFIAGVSDSNGFGWAIAKSLNLAGATVLVGTWAPMVAKFENMLATGALDEDRRFDNGAMSPTGKQHMEIASVYPLDVAFDSASDITPDVQENRRFAQFLSVGRKFTIAEVAAEVIQNYGRIDILVHAIANGPEVSKPLLETSRNGYIAAVAASSFSFVSLVQQFAPKMAPEGSILSLSYLAAEKVIPGYGGGMSSAKAALESDTRTLAFEVGRKYGVRVNTISAGPLKSRAASAIRKDRTSKPFIEQAIGYSRANAPLSRDLEAADVADAALFLLSPMSRAVTGMIVYVDNGLSVMGMAQDSKSLQ